MSKNCCISNNYNSTRTPIVLREYGRIIQSLIHRAKNSPDPRQRLEQALQCIKIMQCLGKHQSEQQYWDSLFIISGYEFDAETPYPRPIPQTQISEVKRMNYPKRNTTFRNLGHNIEELIKKIRTTIDPEKRQELIIYTVRLMKQFSYIWNQGNADYNNILNQLQKNIGEDIKININAIYMSCTEQDKNNKESQVNKSYRNTKYEPISSSGEEND